MPAECPRERGSLVPPAERSAFDRFDQSLLDSQALCADATTVPIAPGSVLTAERARRELRLRVEAAVGADLGAPWVGMLRAASRAHPMKWKDTSDYVLTGQGLGPESVRVGLGEQTIVVTDAMEYLRNLDLDIASSGLPLPMASWGALGVLKPIGDPEIDGFRDTLRAHAAKRLLEGSGVGQVEALTDIVERGTIVGYLDDDEVLAISCAAFVRRLGGSLKQVAKLASQATVLVCGLAPADSRPSEQFTEDDFDWLYDGRLPAFARRRLHQIGQARVVFDAGEENVTGMVDEVRHAAALSSYRWLDDDDDQSEGYARTGDDANYLRMQVADVAAGWASTIVANVGLRGLVKRFAVVMYNGKRLLEDEAARLDRDRAQHRAMLHPR